MYRPVGYGSPKVGSREPIATGVMSLASLRNGAIGSLLVMICAAGVAACGAEEPGAPSTIPEPLPSPTATQTEMPSQMFNPPVEPAPSSSNGMPPPTANPTGSVPPPPTDTALPPPPPPDDTPCGGCVSDARLRCDVATRTCVECLMDYDCAYGSRQACIGGLCTNVDPVATACPETRVGPGDSCGFSGYTCVWGTEGKYSCDCGLGAPIMGGAPLEATVWTCGVTP